MTVVRLFDAGDLEGVIINAPPEGMDRKRRIIRFEDKSVENFIKNRAEQSSGKRGDGK